MSAVAGLDQHNVGLATNLARVSGFMRMKGSSRACPFLPHRPHHPLAERAASSNIFIAIK